MTCFTNSQCRLSLSSNGLFEKRWFGDILSKFKKIGIVFIGNDKSNSSQKFLEDVARGRQPFFKKVSSPRSCFYNSSVFF